MKYTNPILTTSITAVLAASVFAQPVLALTEDGYVKASESNNIYQTGGDKVSAQLSYKAKAIAKKIGTTKTLDTESTIALTVKLGSVTKPVAELVAESIVEEYNGKSIQSSQKKSYFRYMGTDLVSDVANSSGDPLASIGKSISRDFSSAGSFGLEEFTPSIADSWAKNYDISYLVKVYGEIGATNSAAHGLTKYNNVDTVDAKSSAKIYGNLRVNILGDIDHSKFSAEVAMENLSIFSGSAELTAEAHSSKHPHEYEGRTLMAKSFVSSNIKTDKGQLRGEVEVDTGNWLIDGDYDATKTLWDAVTHSNKVVFNETKEEYFGKLAKPEPIGNAMLRTPDHLTTTHPDTCPSKAASADDNYIICKINHRSSGAGYIINIWGLDARYAEVLDVPLYETQTEPSTTLWSENFDDSGNDGYGIDLGSFAGANIRVRVETKAFNECVSNDNTWRPYKLTEYGAQILHLHLNYVDGNLSTCGVEDRRSGNKVFFRLRLEDKNTNVTAWRYFAPIYFYRS